VAVFGFIASGERGLRRSQAHGSKARHATKFKNAWTPADTLIMFPESTSGDGTYMKPLKSALFSVAERHAMGADGVERE